MKDIWKMIIMVALFIAISNALPVVKNLPALPKLTGNEVLSGQPIPYIGGRQSPGDSVGWTAYDYQANGTFGCRLFVDELFQAHIDWMKMESSSANRRCEWQFMYPDHSLYGEVDASPMTAGYVQLDVTREPEPKTVIAYHYNAGAGYYSWIDIDQGNGWGILPNNPTTPAGTDHIWPYIAVANNNANIVMVTGDYGGDFHHMYLSTDLGNTWTYLAEYDSCLDLSQYVWASTNPGSQKIVHAWTQSIALEYSGYLISQMACDVFYQLSNDNGVTWGTPINITHYTPPAQMVNGDTSAWAYCDVDAHFDNNDNLHIVWSTNMGWVHNDTIYFNDRAKIFHWDEVSNTITTVNSPSIYYNEPNGWWLEGTGEPGAWRLACDHPQLIIGNGDTLFCVWGGNDDYTDLSANGYFNGELYAAYSTDNGASWSNYVNLTNTRSPGAGAGACMDEDYFTVYHRVVNDSVYITFVEDKDAGSYPHGESDMTNNPVRVWLLHKSELMYGVAENKAEAPQKLGLNIVPNPVNNRSLISYALPTNTNISLKLYSIDGRLVRTIEQGYRSAGTYTVNFNTRELANGTYFTVLETKNNKITRSLVIVH